MYSIMVNDDGTAVVVRNGVRLDDELVSFELTLRRDAHGFRVQEVVIRECPRPAPPAPTPGPYSGT